MEAFRAFLETNWGWSAGLAGSVLALTALAHSLLNPARKDEIARWLMGAQSEENWSQSFVSLFDAVFGERHISLRCFLRSAIASLIAVIVIWFLMGGFGDLRLRVKSELSLAAVLFIALAVNVVADYVSLLETRWLLGQMHRVRSVLAQAGALLFDFIVSAAIIWVAIVAYLNSPLHEGEIESFAEILGVFSIFSVIFYSTFLTSVWSWAYVLSTWVMRLFQRLRLPYFLNVENRPILVLGHVLALVVFLGSLAVAVPMQKDAENLTFADRTLCTVFKGRVCLAVAKLTQTERAKLDLIMLACEGGVTHECFLRGTVAFINETEEAPRLLTAACDGGDTSSCMDLGWRYAEGYGVNKDPVLAVRFYSRACDGGDARGCINSGVLHLQGLGLNEDPVKAAGFFRRGCDGGELLGCTQLGILHMQGLGVNEDPVKAAQLFRRGCEGGELHGCTNLGVLHMQGQGVNEDPVKAAEFFHWGCEGDDARGCTQLGILHMQGLGVYEDPVEAARLLRRGCDLGEEEACKLAERMAKDQ